jgi:hypothetical protein
LFETDPGRLLLLLRDRASARKLRLFAVACYRTDLIDLGNRGDGAERAAVAVAEAMADGRADSVARDAAERGLSSLVEADCDGDPSLLAVPYPLIAPRFEWWDAANCAGRVVDRCRYDSSAYPGQAKDAEAEQEQLIRDLFGNPFRSVVIDPRWRTADVAGLARGAYEDRDFARLPILADALTDAGCEAELILDHCRSHGPHVRGCWVVDLLLGKE